MLITDEVLKNLKLEIGPLSPERCEEIDKMPIPYPYPDGFTVSRYRDFKAEREEFVYALDGRIAFARGFAPMPIVARESEKNYDTVYLLFIDDEFFELVFRFIPMKDESDYVISEHSYHYDYLLEENENLTKRRDNKNIILLLEKMYFAEKIDFLREFGRYVEYDMTIIYRGERF